MWPQFLCLVPQRLHSQCSQTIHFRCSTSSAIMPQIEARISVGLTVPRCHGAAASAMGRTAYSVPCAAAIDHAMDALRVPDGDRDVTTLSGGERRRVALCRLLLSAPDLLLLDEPTNHLDAESVAWLERFLADYKGTVVAVTHDRYFLDNVAGWILELDRGRGIPYQGNYSGWLEQKQVRLAIEEKTESARRRTLARERERAPRIPRAR